MENIGSTSSDYSYLFEDIVSSSVNQIRKTAILQHQGDKLKNAENISNEIASGNFNTGGYGFDSSIPENSSFSLHI